MLRFRKIYEKEILSVIHVYNFTEKEVLHQTICVRKDDDTRIAKCESALIAGISPDVLRKNGYVEF